jgi:hypothetical protein
MACKNCKKKTLTQQESKKEFNLLDKGVTWMIIIWFLLGIYGLYTFVTDIIHLLK